MKREAKEFAELTAEDNEREPALVVAVDFNGLLEQVGEPDVWDILGKLKDLLG